MLENTDRPGLLLKGQIMGTLEAFEEHADIYQIILNLSNSRSRTSRKLPPAYRDRRVYVFYPMSTYDSSKYHKSLLLKEWSQADRNSSMKIPQTVQDSEFAFLLAHINGDEAARTSVSAQQEGKSQGMLKALGGADDRSRPLATGDATPKKMATGLRDGSNGANNFELLGLVQIQSNLTLPEISSRLEDIYQTVYTRGPCIVRIL